MHQGGSGTSCIVPFTSLGIVQINNKVPLRCVFGVFVITDLQQRCQSQTLLAVVQVLVRTQDMQTHGHKVETAGGA